MEPQEMAKILGIPLFQTPFFLPQYPDGEWGQWRLSHMTTGIDHGYYTRQWFINNMPVLLRRNPQQPKAWDTWMSLTPHEIESQELGCRFARGHTVVMGLGMGWIALNMALNPAVNQITVIERDPEVIALFDFAKLLEQVPPEVRKKLRVVEADALDWQPRQAVDFLFADIWRDLAEANALPEVRCMQQHVNAKEVYYWGQELALHSAFRRRFGYEIPLAFQSLQQCTQQEIKLPLLLPRAQDPDYLVRIEEVVKNRLTRRLPVEVPAS